eukprot:TRINITY_DN65621_c10_g2_i3.p1 TRINITY_DN65621_c10_g2~~TRINITY_DN65621_c10_g2_i3.p1  ORF type:complete len:553 (+),score=326.43 TRINITY_DN65621_c10_g2_i3:863-2521(+)
MPTPPTTQVTLPTSRDSSQAWTSVSSSPVTQKMQQQKMQQQQQHQSSSGRSSARSLVSVGSSVSSSARSGSGNGMEVVDNPFKIPTDEDIFLLREREKQERVAKRERAKRLKVWEKDSHNVAASARNRTTFEYKKKGRSKRGGAAAGGAAAGGGMFPSSTRRDRESMAEFIAKKRDMFLIQMSLDTKREEIRKLEEKAKMKEDALRKSEEMLDEDATRFDAFLRENDRKAHEAMQRADRETKLKQEKIAELKKLNQQITKVEGEMNKHEDELKLCTKYKAFLDKLTPPEHFEQLRARKAAKAERMREAGLRVPADLDDVELSDDEDEMYFKEPAQLLEIFAQLEERNLFLIQNVQETEEALEELKQKKRDTEAVLNEKTEQLQTNINELRQKIGLEDEKSSTLTTRTGASVSVSEQNQILSALASKVNQVYVKCVGEPLDSMDTLDMLREIESELEELLSKMERMDPKDLEQGEHEKERERRERVRQAKYEEQQRQYEERLAKSTARSKGDVKKKTGRPVMFRSAPLRKTKKKQEKKKKKDEEAEDIKRFFT